MGLSFCGQKVEEIPPGKARQKERSEINARNYRNRRETIPGSGR